MSLAVVLLDSVTGLQAKLSDRITAEKYVAAAYLVVFAFVLLYVLIIAAKLGRLSREVEELAELVRARRERGGVDELADRGGAAEATPLA